MFWNKIEYFESIESMIGVTLERRCIDIITLERRLCHNYMLRRVRCQSYTFSFFVIRSNILEESFNQKVQKGFGDNSRQSHVHVVH